MQTLMRLCGLVVLLSITSVAGLAQSGTPEPGDPPVASLISVSAPDDNGIVTVSGSAGAVFPGAQVAVRNLYTEDTAYVTAGITGSFSVQIYGPGTTPFLISPAQTITPAQRNVPGSLPGGPGTIIYGNVAYPQPSIPTTQIRIDGHQDDWAESYPETLSLPPTGEAVFGLLNRDSLYILIDDTPPETYTRLRVTFVLDGITYSVSLDPRRFETATIEQVAPNASPIGTIAVAAAQDAVLELRIPVAALDTEVSDATLISVQFLDNDDEDVRRYVIEQPILQVVELDGILYPTAPLGTDATRFFMAGPIAQGASHWAARGRVNTLDFNAGDRLIIELDVTMDVPDLAESLVGLRMIGELSLQPVIDEAGHQIAGGRNSSNGWSSLLTPSGLPIDNVRGDFVLGEAAVEPQHVVRRGDQLLFGLRFEITLPADLPPGIYVPILAGYSQIGDSDRFAWVNNGPFGRGDGLSRVPQTRLPLVMTVGGVDTGRLLWALFYDFPSDGSRGILPDEEIGTAALSNRVRFNSPVYILPPGVYPIEPYLPAQLANAYDTSTAPLLPLLFPGGRLTAQVTRPDGQIDDLGSVAVAQNQLSSPAADETSRFGAFGVVDMARLIAQNVAFSDYRFDGYGEYTINLTGSVGDFWGHTYTGGGTYHLLIAEPLDLTPGTLPGTPFEVGDSFFAGVHLAPGVPADVTIMMRYYPLSGGEVVQQTFSGTADRFGYFYPDEAFRFAEPGEYVVDYEARYTDSEGRLWAASLRAAGVIARPDSQFIAHGRRGLANYNGARSAWFNTAVYPTDLAVGQTVEPRPNYPYHSGDVAYIPDSATSGMRPIVQVQDVGGAYETWLLNNHPTYRAAPGTIQRLAVEDALPLIPVLGGPETPYSPAMIPDLIVSDAYGYVSAVRPDVSVRQFIHGGDDESLHTEWDSDDPLNEQIGAGIRGSRPGDYVFLFGGAIVRNAEAGSDAAIYAAVAVTTDANSDAAVYPPFRGEAGGGSLGPLLQVNGQDVTMFFHPTGVRPGQVLPLGGVLAVAGQIAPTVPADVEAQIVSPSGEVYTFDGTANAIGYFYDPANDFAVDEPGLWTVEIRVTYSGYTSAGEVEPPYPTGTVLGTTTGQFPVYVVSPTAPALTTNQGNGGNVVLTTRSGAPINFSVDLPRGLSSYNAYYTLSTPSYLVDSGRMQLGTTSASYQYNPTALAQAFPNLEFDSTVAGRSASDVITATFVVTAMDEGGQPVVRSRTFIIMHDQLISIEALDEE